MCEEEGAGRWGLRRQRGGGWGFIRCEESSDRERERGKKIYTLQGEKTWERARE